MKVIWLLLLLTFTWTLPSACVRAETGQIIAKTETNLQSDNMETELQSEITQTDTMQHLLDDLELTQVQKMLDDMLGENSFSLTDTLVSLTRGEKIFSGKDLQGIFYRSFFGQLEKQKGLYIRILLLILLAAVFSNFAAVFDNGQIGDTCFYVVYLLLFMVCMDSFSGMSRALQNVLSWMAEFMQVLAPAYFLTVSVSAGTTSAAVFYEGVLLLVWLVQSLLLGILLPGVGMYVLLSLINHLSKEEMLELFPYCPEAVYNTQEVVDKCNFEFEYGHYRMPKVHIPKEYGNDDMRGEKWGATRLIDMVRRLQPGIIIDNRLEVSGEGRGSLYECDPTPYHGDFISPEQIIPPEGICDKEGNPMVWEACFTMNNNWGYCANDHYYKPASMLIKKLVECVSKGGNMILNVGPDAKGKFPKESSAILSEIGRWMDKNHDSIYGCAPAADIPKPDYGRITRNGNKYYVHIYENTLGPLPLIGFDKNKIVKVRALDDGHEVPISTLWVHSDYPDIAFVDLGPDPVLPDPVDYVLEVEMAE